MRMGDQVLVGSTGGRGTGYGGRGGQVSVILHHEDGNCQGLLQSVSTTLSSLSRPSSRGLHLVRAKMEQSKLCTMYDCARRTWLELYAVLSSMKYIQ